MELLEFLESIHSMRIWIQTRFQMIDDLQKTYYSKMCPLFLKFYPEYKLSDFDFMLLCKEKYGWRFSNIVDILINLLSHYENNPEEYYFKKRLPKVRKYEKPELKEQLINIPPEHHQEFIKYFDEEE